MVFDWNILWNNEMVVSRRSRLGVISFWDQVAMESPLNNCQLIQMKDLQLESIPLNDEMDVLEIGPGAGRLTIPLSERVNKVTAIEPSSKMADSLLSNLQDKRIGNVEVFNMNWQEYCEKNPACNHDIVLASYSLFMMEIENQLELMHMMSRGEVYIFLSGDKRMPEEVERIIYGARVSSGYLDYEIICNILKGRGIHPQVSLIRTERNDRYESLDAAKNKFVKFYDCPEEKTGELEDYLRTILEIKYDGCLHNYSQTTAVISWSAEKN